MSIEEYLGYSDKPNCEYREGSIYVKPLPTTNHGLLEFLLVHMLRRLGVQAAPEVTVRLSPTKYLVPDVIAAPVLRRPYPTEPVLLCCEILSPEAQGPPDAAAKDQRNSPVQPRFGGHHLRDFLKDGNTIPGVSRYA